MTTIAAAVLALIAGLTISRSHATRWLVAPWLTVLAVQTAWLASGRGSSPASSVAAFPDVIGYAIVQAVTLALAAWVAGRLAERRNVAPVSSQLESRRARFVVTAISGGATIVVLAATAPAHPGHGGGGATEAVAGLALLACLATGATLEVLRRIRPAHHAPTAVRL